MTASAQDQARIVSISLSAEKGTAKEPVPEARLDEYGIVGDAHAGPWHRQVSLLALEAIERFAAQSGETFAPGDFAENLCTHGLDLPAASLLDRLRIGEVVLEVTQRGKTCHGDSCAVYQRVGRCVMPKEGVFCRVLHGGVIRPGDTIVHEPKTLGMAVITVSDRASQGRYEDRSGPRIAEMLEAHFANTLWRIRIDPFILPDDAARIEAQLVHARDTGADVVFTTGGTGIGPRDITPDVVTALADKLIPGIMEHIRITYGADKANALLSRSVAAVLGQTLVYTLPGSLKAVNEYLDEILKTLEHSLHMIHGLDTHQ